MNLLKDYREILSTSKVTGMHILADIQGDRDLVSSQTLLKMERLIHFTHLLLEMGEWLKQLLQLMYTVENLVQTKLRVTLAITN